MQALIAILPILFLLLAMGGPRAMSGTIALPIAALFAFIIYYFALDLPMNRAAAASIDGALSALTPISIIFGAMLLFAVLRSTGQLEVFNSWIRSISSHPVAQLMLIGWSFPFFIEGISGFGTPAAIAAPLLVGLGFSPLKACLMTLISNGVPVAFGAIGTPIWFGLGGLGLTMRETLALSGMVGTIQSFSSVAIAFFALSQVLTLRDIIRNSSFVILAVLASVLPFWLVSQFSYEFPSLIGGAIGFAVTLFLAKAKVGLAPVETQEAHFENESPRLKAILTATFPLWSSVIILLLTRLPGLGIGATLGNKDPWIQFAIPFVGSFNLSRSLVFSLDVTLGGPTILSHWNHAALYVPSLLPFVLVSAISVFVFPVSNRRIFWVSSRDTVVNLWKPYLALSGALVLVKLLMAENSLGDSAITQIGGTIGELFGESWPWFAMNLGVLGSFAAGSATISNLTFGGLQNVLGTSIDEKLLVLALQASGASLGNMVCLHNIIAVTTILGLKGHDHKILRRNALVLVFTVVMATLMAIVVYSP